jgi:membrane-bound serine protease (ClpP class)
MPTLKTLRQAPVLNEDDLLLGVEGRVVQPIDPIGVVHVHGENWTATSDAPIEAGEEVVVLERDGLQLRVEALKHKRTPIAQEEAQQNGS